MVPEATPKSGTWRATAPGASILTGMSFLLRCMGSVLSGLSCRGVGSANRAVIEEA
jgi:hypothetical protein